MNVATLTTDNREHHRKYEVTTPYFGTAPEALLQGFATLPDVEVHVVTCTQRPMLSPEKLADNIWFHSLLAPKIGWMRTGYQGCIRAIRRKLRQIQPDVVHGQGTERECAISAVFSGFPNVVTIHGNLAELARIFPPSIGSYLWLAARLENFTLPRTHGVFCNSAYTESLTRSRAKKVWRVPNAIREEFFQPQIKRAGGDIPVLLNIGVLCPRKRQLELLRLAGKLHARGCRFLLRFVGQSGDSSDYERQFFSEIEQARSEGYAEHAGAMGTGELIASMDTATALVHFPNEEAFGLVVAEALARNLKFFGSKLGGIIDISEGVEGAKLIDGDRWDSLGDAIAGWLKTGASKPQTAAAEIASRYHPLIIAKRHLEIYREVLRQT